jgi:hypothetical protein
MTYASPTWEYVADVCLLKLQPLQITFLRAIRNFGRRTLVREMHLIFKTCYVYDYITQLCRTQVNVFLNHRNAVLRSIGQEDAMRRSIKRLKFGGG